jgi:hypothetical protein
VYLICPYSLGEGALDVEFISIASGLEIANIENIDPFEISDTFTPNKHGVLFKEFIYVKG